MRNWCILEIILFEQACIPVLKNEIIPATKFYLGGNFYNWDINPCKDFYNGNADTTLAALRPMASLYYSTLDHVCVLKTVAALSASEQR